jgi:hemerythrin-like domain-containing protein
MRITDALLGEHAIMYELFYYVEHTVGNTDNLQEISGVLTVLEKLLLSHARVEEDLLFPQLEPYLGKTGPLSVMLAEHRGMDDLMASAKCETDVVALKSTIAQLLQLARGHFQKEEMALFGMARKFLDEDTLIDLGDQWAASRNVIIDGPGCMSAA